MRSGSHYTMLELVMPLMSHFDSDGERSRADPEQSTKSFPMAINKASQWLSFPQDFRVRRRWRYCCFVTPSKSSLHQCIMLLMEDEHTHTLAMACSSLLVVINCAGRLSIQWLHNFGFGGVAEQTNSLLSFHKYSVWMVYISIPPSKYSSFSYALPSSSAIVLNLESAPMI